LKHLSPIVAGAAALVFSRSFLARLALSIAAMFLAPLPAQAQCDSTLQCCVTPQPGGNPTCGSDSPADLPRTGASLGAGNPVDIISGNKYQRETDLPALPGVLGLELVRHYNSALRQRDTGGLGRGWRLSYQAELHAGHESLSIVQSDGRTLRFARGFAEPDTYTAADEQQGRVQRVRSSSGVHFTWTWPSGRALRFDNGKLTQIREPSGEFVSLQHAPGGELVQVRDPQGRALHLIYDSKRRLQAIETRSAATPTPRTAARRTS
jgi:YD repeat-containing protein